MAVPVMVMGYRDRVARWLCCRCRLCIALHGHGWLPGYDSRGRGAATPRRGRGEVGRVVPATAVRQLQVPAAFQFMGRDR